MIIIEAAASHDSKVSPSILAIETKAVDFWVFRENYSKLKKEKKFLVKVKIISIARSKIKK